MLDDKRRMLNTDVGDFCAALPLSGSRPCF